MKRAWCLVSLTIFSACSSHSAQIPPINDRSLSVHSVTQTSFSAHVKEISVPNGTITGTTISAAPNGAVYYNSGGGGGRYLNGVFTFTGPASIQGFTPAYSVDLIAVNNNSTAYWTEGYQYQIGQRVSDILQIGANGSTASQGAGVQENAYLSGPNSQLYADMIVDRAGRIWIVGGMWGSGDPALDVWDRSTNKVITKNYLQEAFSTLALAPDGNVWASGFKCPSNIYGGDVTGCAGELVKFDAQANIIKRIPVATNAIGGLTFDKSGNIWFTDQGKNKIGVATQAGQIKAEYPIHTPNSVPQRIVYGPDGAFWFTETAGDKIGRVTPSGWFLEYPLSNAAPYGISVSPVGTSTQRTIWFIEKGHLGQISITL